MLTKFRLVQRVATRMTYRCKLYDALQIKLYALKLHKKMHVDDTWVFEDRRGELSWKSSEQFFQSRIDWPGESERGTLYVDGQNKTFPSKGRTRVCLRMRNLMWFLTTRDVNPCIFKSLFVRIMLSIRNFQTWNAGGRVIKVIQLI